ncbi:MAG: class I lanthipeptide [Saprospiraceae bacterium]|nr:class I lanthipeptide [Saprospiraceae bacterium]
MKKVALNPLQLDKETIALLDGKQLQDIVGGAHHAPSSSGGTSTGCGSGSSQCLVAGRGN